MYLQVIVYRFLEIHNRNNNSKFHQAIKIQI
jgi:hypothetical protein